MKPKLQQNDYVYLYPLMSPTEISEEFGDRAYGARSIQIIYKKLGLKPSHAKLKEIYKRSIMLAESSQEDWVEKFWNAVALEREYRKQVVWARVSEAEELYS